MTNCPLCNCDRFRREPAGWTCADCDFLVAPFDIGDPSETPPLDYVEALGRDLDRQRYAEADTLARRGVQR